MTPPLMLYDGECGLCNRAVQFVLDHDHAAVFRFAALQSPLAQRELAAHGLSNEAFDTFVLIEGGRTHLRSAAAFRVLHLLGGVWRVISLLRHLPRPLTDLGYRMVAANRLRFFGRTENTCRMMRPALRERFLD